MTDHVCDWKSPWPTGHPLPPEDPAKLEGPEVGGHPIYIHKSKTGKGQPDGTTVWTETVEYQPATVLERSYVWSPGECRSKGGYRHYNWSVIRTVGEGRSYVVVVNDTDLMPVEAPAYAGMTDQA